MAIKRAGAAMGLALTLGAGCASETAPNPAPTTSPTSTEQFTPMPWPSLEVCEKEQGVYTLPEDPAPQMRCAVGKVVKERIDDRQKIEVFKGTIDVSNLGDTALNGSCLFQPLVTQVQQGEDWYTYLGVTRVGPKDTGAEIFIFPFTPTEPITSKHLQVTVAKATSEGVYTMDYQEETYAIGLLSTQKTCSSDA